MKYIQRTKTNIDNDFFRNLLIDRKIIDSSRESYENFIRPRKDFLLEPTLLDNMEEGFKLFKKHLDNNSTIYFVVDCDVDGFTSSSVLINYFNDNLKEKYPNVEIQYHVPEAKAHGLSTIMENFTNKKICDLIICADSSSNDFEEHKILKDLGYDILVLDHHITSHYSENAVVINNQLSENYSNKNLSGVGVVYKFLQYCDEQFNFNNVADNYLDLVAFGEISDMMEMTTLENRYICKYGLDHINNQFMKDLIEKQSYSLGDNLTQIGVAFYLTPLVNALIRIGSQTEKENLFKAFIDGLEIVPSTKRGDKGNFETISVQSVRNCVNAKAKQNREKEKAMEILDIQIIENCLDDNKILILNADELDVPNSLTGLIAMGVSAKYKKPVLLGRTSPDGFLKGSGRGRNGSELQDFRQFLLDSGYMDFAEGHSQAFGQSIKISNIDKLTNYANYKLADINFNEGFYEADFVVNGSYPALSTLIEEMDKGKTLWSQGNDEPIIIIKNIQVNKNEISIIGKNHDTIRLVYNGITYIKFKAEEIIKMLDNISDDLIITIAGRANINEWGGQRKPQILADEMEIIDVSF